MTRRIRALLGSWALLATIGSFSMPAVAQQPRGQSFEAHGLRFVLTPDRSGGATVTVTSIGARNGRRELLRLDRASDAYDAERPRRWVFLHDANFDRYPDLWVLQNDAMANTSYSLELFDPGTLRFVPVPEFEALSNPQVDSRNRRISTSARGGCCEHSNAIYRWRGAELELMAEWGDAMPEVDWPGRDCFVRLWRRERQGERVVDRPDRYVPMHVFNGRRRASPECRDAPPPPQGDSTPR